MTAASRRCAANGIHTSTTYESNKQSVFTISVFECSVSHTKREYEHVLGWYTRTARSCVRLSNDSRRSATLVISLHLNFLVKFVLDIPFSQSGRLLCLVHALPRCASGCRMRFLFASGLAFLLMRAAGCHSYCTVVVIATRGEGRWRGRRGYYSHRVVE